jgi:ferredoxin
VEGGAEVKITIDREVCILAGRCRYFHPQLFAENEDGTPQVAVDPVGPEHRAAILEAIEECPSGAIALEEEVRRE